MDAIEIVFNIVDSQDNEATLRNMLELLDVNKLLFKAFNVDGLPKAKIYELKMRCV